MKKRFLTKILAVMLVACMLMGNGMNVVLAANDYYYKGYDITYNGGQGFKKYSESWRGGFLWLIKYREDYYLTNSYMRCLTYYHDTWIANQGQVLTISDTRNVSRSVEEGVSSEIGVSFVFSLNIGAEYTDSVTTSYGKSMGMSYDLSKYKHKSYRVASMGFYDKFRVEKYKNGKYKESYTVYGYDKKFGQEIRLVYRY